ncbi:hypothetical protein WN55_08288 [Dufourea novaeangliae]|uniref:Uncharacterized protein n=1 Tax=Dufourea novaeangliae TaxID=178035 RepID=A0A154P6M0_DUFNO|nr:hypothetical protein WN55_08288 [Dufourea novaeangliae]
MKYYLLSKVVFSYKYTQLVISNKVSIHSTLFEPSFPNKTFIPSPTSVSTRPPLTSGYHRSNGKQNKDYIRGIVNVDQEAPCICSVVRRCQRSSRRRFLRSVPKGGRTVNWAGESPNYIPSKYETNRNTSDGRTNDPAAITAVDTGGTKGVVGIETLQGSRGRIVAEDGHRTGLTEAGGLPFIGHKSNNAMPYDTRADTEVRQNDTNAWNPAPVLLSRNSTPRRSVPTPLLRSDSSVGKFGRAGFDFLGGLRRIEFIPESWNREKKECPIGVVNFKQ